MSSIVSDIFYTGVYSLASLHYYSIAAPLPFKLAKLSIMSPCAVFKPKRVKIEKKNYSDFLQFPNSKKNSFRWNYMRKYGINVRYGSTGRGVFKPGVQN